MKERGVSATGGFVSGSRAENAETVQGESEESRATPEFRRQAASRLIHSHDAVFRRTARRYSLCAEDAEDAYQRSLEILLTKAPPLEGDSLVRWMQVVTKRESLAVRRQRERLLGGHSVNRDDDRDLLDTIPSDSDGPTERAASRERVARSREALKSLKPQEVRALTLKAQGYSYAEIGEITGWTYTKVNRCMAEGRKRFLQVFSDIEQGRRCEELATALSALADGERDVAGAGEVSEHLRSCATCRARLRAFRAIPDRVFELLPTGPAVDQSSGGRAQEWLADRLGGAVEKLREGAYSVVNRGAGSEGEVAAGGITGGLQASAAKALAVCGVAAAGAGGTYCAVNKMSPADLLGSSPRSEQAVVKPIPVKPAVDAAPINPASPPPTPPEPAPPPPPPAPAEPTVSAPQVEELTPAQQASNEVGFEEPPEEGTTSSGGDFSAPSGGSGAEGSAGGGGGFGIE
jgi:RNA polymerase sigma factor (sigma-70 family)